MRAQMLAMDFPSSSLHLPPEHGPWDDEPDFAHWTDAHSGYRCMCKRTQTGAWCGYVNVPRNHPWHGLDYDEVDDKISVHGGITFANPWLAEGDWWFGFDCGHAWDIQPALHAFLEDPETVYRDLAYVQDQIELLALQLWAIAKGLPVDDE
jgi:hypothetical protein